jgi:6-phosphogluconolactonase (cycloisomerase 2 family)
MRRLVLACTLLVLVLCSPAAAAPNGALRFFDEPGPPPAANDTLAGGCLAFTIEEARGTQRCDTAPQLRGAIATAISPDGRNLYAAAVDGDAVVAFARDPRSGQLTVVGCVSEEPAAGCVDGQGLDGADGVTVSPDGQSVYVTARTSVAIASFTRDPVDGTIAATGCISEGGKDGCTAGRGLDHAVGIVATPDGRDVYVAARAGDAVAVLSRDDTGALTQAAGPEGCVSTGTTPGCSAVGGLDGAYGLALSGSTLYVASRVADAIVVLARAEDGTLSAVGTPVTGRSLDGVTAVAVSPDGRNVYTGSYAANALTAFDRDTATGALTRVECFSQDRLLAECTATRGLTYTDAVTVSPDGRTVYAAGGHANALAIMQRNADGRISQVPAPLAHPWSEGCMSWRGHPWDAEQDLGAADHSNHVCARGLALWWPYAVVVSPDGRHVYAASRDSGSVTLFQRLTDGAGDTAAPDTWLGPGPAAATRETSASFAFSASEGDAILGCRLDDQEWRECTPPANLSGLAEGAHAFRVRAYDAAGNADATAPEARWTIDVSAPVATLSGGATGPTSARFAFASEAGATFACRLDRHRWSPCVPPRTLRGLRDGRHVFAVRAIDAVGNVGEVVSSAWRVRTRPRVVLVPRRGRVLRGRLVANGRRTAYWFEFTRAPRGKVRHLAGGTRSRLVRGRAPAAVRGRYRLVARNAGGTSRTPWRRLR